MLCLCLLNLISLRILLFMFVLIATEGGGGGYDLKLHTYSLYMIMLSVLNWKQIHEPLQIADTTSNYGQPSGTAMHVKLDIIICQIVVEHSSLKVLPIK